jgi:glycosyltransferase involved in cell wall biosynthesis
MCRAAIGAVVLLSSGMAYYAPGSLQYIADWGDVDSEKRLAYGRMRPGGFIHCLEGRRLRTVERDYAMRARLTLLTTENELALFRSFAPDIPAACCGNGVDGNTFDPGADFAIPDDLHCRRFLVFVGMLDYYPNVDGICRFATEVFPVLRRRNPNIELFVVGRSPTREVQRLGVRDGIIVTGAVDDVRPYLARAQAVVVPLRIARGVQNKVLEALAMGKPVLASEEACATFHPVLPRGVVRCRSTEEYAAAVEALPPRSTPDPSIAASARTRFDWAVSLRPLIDALHAIAQERSDAGPSGRA